MNKLLFSSYENICINNIKHTNSEIYVSILSVRIHSLGTTTGDDLTIKDSIILLNIKFEITFRNNC